MEAMVYGALPPATEAATAMALEPRRDARPEPSASLVEACRHGDREAVAELFEACKDRVYSLALHLTGNPAEAGDLTQDVFLRLLGRIEQYRGDARFSTWLYRVVVNVFLDRRKSSRRWMVLDETALARRASAEPSPEALLIHSQVQQRVASAVAQLPVKLRLPLVLRYATALSYAQIAETLGVREGTVASRLNRALKQLADGLKDVPP
jgi:RNA polymerase sigma-70 factor (ECF subfamily)